MATSDTNTDALALLPLPTHSELSEPQVRGKSCVWCGATLNSAIAVDLGQRRVKLLDSSITTFPRGCRTCTAQEAYKALVEHTAACKACKSRGGLCSARDELVALRRKALR